MASSTPEREALCHALTRVVDERGWTGTSPARVAYEAGLAPHEFYDHFRSLEQCYLAVYDRMLARITRTALRAVGTTRRSVLGSSWGDQLDAVMDAVLAFYSVEPALARTCLVEVLMAGPAARARRDYALHRFTDYVEGLRLSHGDTMPPLAAEMIVLGTTELIYKRVERGEAEGLRELLPELRQLWLRSVAEYAEPAALAS